MALGKNIGADASPSFSISINDHEIDENVSSLITSIEWDSTDEGSADMMKLTVSNPNFEVSGKKIFQIGNTIKLWGGHGSEMSFIGGAIIEKVRPNFPGAEAMPTIEVVAYSADRLMMRNSPPPAADGLPFLSEAAKKRRDKSQKRKKKGPAGKVWHDGAMYSDAIEDKASTYSFKIDVDQTGDHLIGPLGVFQKQNLTDYQFVAGISNDLGWLFWVDADEHTPVWTLHFKDPDLASEIQDFEIEFIYNNGDNGTLISFEGEQLMGNGPVELQIQIKNVETGKLETYSITADDGVDVEYGGDPTAILLDAPRAPQEVTISFGNVAIKTISDRQFQSPAQVKQWADQWYEKNKKHFFSGRASVRGPGIEKLTARQVHKVSGLDATWDGHYYFTNVNLKWNSGSGFEAVWNGRKITSRALTPIRPRDIAGEVLRSLD